MRRRAVVIVGAAVLCSALLAGGGTAVAGLATAAGARAGTLSGWDKAEPVPGLATLSAGGGAAIYSVSCGSAGNCSVGGDYATGTTSFLPFVASQVNGTWGAAEEVPGLARLYSDIPFAAVNSVACASAGNCTAVGSFDDPGPLDLPFGVSEVNGTWGTAQEIPVPAALAGNGGFVPYSVSCGSPGNCSAGGEYAPVDQNFQAWVASQAHGKWSKAEEVPGIAAINVGPRYIGTAAGPVSCASAGNCSAVGIYADSSDFMRPFVVSQVHGVWGHGQEEPGITALNAGEGAGLSSVSCASAGNCSAGGGYGDLSGPGVPVHPYVVSQVDGTWGKPEQVPGSAALNVGESGSIEMVSCASPGDCSAGGLYTDRSGGEQSFVVSEVSGVWGKAEEVPGSATLDHGGQTYIESLSCASAGNCSASGEYEAKGSAIWQAFVVSQVNGTWRSAQEVPGSAAVNTTAWPVIGATISLSCRLPGNCTAAGSYAHGQPFVVSEVTPGSASSATAVTSTTRHPVAGQPVTVKVAVSARPRTSGTPAGAVTVIAGARSCRARLSGNGGRSTGSCTIREDAPGRYPLTASYPGNSVFAASTSPAGTLNVAKARSKTALDLSVSAVAYGHERALKLSVHVTPEFSGTPVGKVTISTRRTTLCSITVTARSGGRGSCRLTSNTRLRPGKHILTARYHGSSEFAASTSARAALHVTH